MVKDMEIINAQQFNEYMKEDAVLVDFFATWCGPCKMLTPVLETISDKINIIKIDIDEFPELTSKYRIMSVPTLIFVKDGEKQEEIVGFHTEDELLEIIEKL